VYQSTTRIREPNPTIVPAAVRQVKKGKNGKKENKMIKIGN
jgi:hypothetical protein